MLQKIKFYLAFYDFDYLHLEDVNTDILSFIDNNKFYGFELGNIYYFQAFDDIGKVFCKISFKLNNLKDKDEVIGNCMDEFRINLDDYLAEFFKEDLESAVSYPKFIGVYISTIDYINFEKINKMYGSENVDAWIEERNKLLDVNSLKVFTNPILKQWGLDKVLV